MTAPLSTALERILSCEHALDDALLDWREIESWNHAWAEPAARWSKAVWDAAVALGPLPMAAGDLSAGEHIARSPVFVCGAPRSGTTLVRDLLDGHPSLAVLPAEGRFFEQFGFVPLAQQKSALERQGLKWIGSLANPNHQRPFWLLGRSTARSSPYVKFARRFITWSEILAHHDLAARAQAAAALSLAQVTEQEVASLTGSVDKTPGYEFHLQRIWSLWPRAKVIYLLRDPSDVEASYRRGVAHTKLKKPATLRLTRALIRSHLAARWAIGSAPERGFLVVEYARLVQHRRSEMTRIAQFLDVPWSDSLVEQTILGRPAEPNSPFRTMSRPKYEAKVSERVLLSLSSLTKRVLERCGGEASGAFTRRR